MNQTYLLGGSDMSTPENNFSRRERLKITTGFRLRIRVLAGIAAILMGASLIFSVNVSAHNIDVKKARELVRDYARGVRDGSGGKYIHYSTRSPDRTPDTTTTWAA
jgi:hypothetical protein